MGLRPAYAFTLSPLVGRRLARVSRMILVFTLKNGLRAAPGLCFAEFPLKNGLRAGKVGAAESSDIFGADSGNDVACLCAADPGRGFAWNFFVFDFTNVIPSLLHMHVHAQLLLQSFAC